MKSPTKKDAILSRERLERRSEKSSRNEFQFDVFGGLYTTTILSGVGLLHDIIADSKEVHEFSEINLGSNRFLQINPTLPPRLFEGRVANKNE